MLFLTRVTTSALMDFDSFLTREHGLEAIPV
jgi:hypothetical protein